VEKGGGINLDVYRVKNEMTMMVSGRANPRGEKVFIAANIH
jgi:hypothetical protein